MFVTQTYNSIPVGITVDAWQPEEAVSKDSLRKDMLSREANSSRTLRFGQCDRCTVAVVHELSGHPVIRNALMLVAIDCLDIRIAIGKKRAAAIGNTYTTQGAATSGRFHCQTRRPREWIACVI